jgi:hypothetical protein
MSTMADERASDEGGPLQQCGLFLIEGGLYSVTALRETWARRRCIRNTRIYMWIVNIYYILLE